MKKLLALCLSVCLAVLIMPMASAEKSDIYLRVEVGYDWDYYFADLGQEVSIYTILENASEADLAAFKPKFKYTTESADYDEAVGFKWKDIEGDGTATLKWIPEEEGLYCFGAEGTVPSTQKEVDSVDRGIPVVLVVDMDNKTVVKTEDELIAAVNSGAHFISVQGDIEITDKEVHINQQSVLEIAEGYTLTLTGSVLHMGIGKWNMGSTVLVEGNILVNEGSSLATGDYPVDMYVSGRIIGWDAQGMNHVQYIASNVSPFEEFTGSYIEDKATGITTVVDEMTNATILNITTLSFIDPIYTAMEALDNGEVLMAFESDVANHEGEYTLTIPVDKKYNGKELTVYILDKSVSGYTEPSELKVLCSEGKINITVDSNDIVMIKAPAKLLEGPALIAAIVAAAALVIMVVLMVVSSKKKNNQKEEETEE